MPKATLPHDDGLGPGLTREQNDRRGTFWAVGDCRPDLKAKTLVERYGVGRTRERLMRQSAIRRSAQVSYPNLLRQDPDCGRRLIAGLASAF